MNSAQYLNSKEHKDWAAKVKLRDGCRCVICKAGPKYVNAHHLISKDIIQHRLDINNGISLCPMHHSKYGKQLSPHNDNNFSFYIWFMTNRPEQFFYIKNLLNNEI